MYTRSDIEVVFGSNQLCTDLKTGIEGLFMLCQTCLTLILTLLMAGVSCLMNACNVFNALNHIAMSLHAHIL